MARTTMAALIAGLGLSLGVAQTATAAQFVIFAPRVEAATASQAHQGPYVQGSNSTIVNGTVTGTNTGPAGGTEASGNAAAVTSSSFQFGSTNAGEALYNETFASASLATGLLKASVAADGPNNFGSPLGFASARIDDTFFFTNNTASALVATFTYAFDGALSDPFAGNPGGNLGLAVSCAYFACYNDANTPIKFATGPDRVADGNMNFYFGLANAYFGENIYGGQGSAPYFETHLDTPPGASVIDGYIRTSLLIPTGTTSLGFSGLLNLDCRGGSSCDFGHTGKFAFDPLPEGLGFSSASGLFPLQEVNAAVPEPSTWAMLILGFGAIGSVLRGNRRRVGLSFAR